MKKKSKRLTWAWFKSIGRTKEDRLDFGAVMPPGPENPRCVECGLCLDTYTPFTFPKIGKGDLVFLVNQPTEEESYEGEMGTTLGRERIILSKYIARGELKCKDSDYSIIPSVLCRTAKKPGVKSLQMCRPFVLQAMGKIKATPLRIVAMGVEAGCQAFQRTIKLKEHIGETFVFPLGEVMVTYSPSNVLVKDLEDGGYKMGMLDVIKNHVKRFFNREPNKEFPPMEIV